MGKRGRPRMNGAKPGWTFARVALVLQGYDQSRSAGSKHSTAIADAVDNVRKRKPELSISETEVKRILAELRPKHAEQVLKFAKLPPAALQQAEAGCQLFAASELKFPSNWNSEIPPKDWKPGAVFAMGFGPRPQYPRTNARTFKSVPPSSGKKR